MKKSQWYYECECGFKVSHTVAKVALTDGRSCGRAGAGCARVNMAMPYPLLVDCLNRMHDALQADGLL